MRPVREITGEEENFRLVPVEPGSPMEVIRRDPVEPEPVGTLVLVAFRITGYDSDCDGSLMARLEHINRDGAATGWTQNCIGLYSEGELVVSPEELRQLGKNGG
jgi:hypothetical protein